MLGLAVYAVWQDGRRREKEIQKEILVGYYARKMCGMLSDMQIESMFQLAKSDGVLPLIKERGNFDWHSDLILALAKKAPVRSIQSFPSLVPLKEF